MFFPWLWAYRSSCSASGRALRVFLRVDAESSIKRSKMWCGEQCGTPPFTKDEGGTHCTHCMEAGPPPRPAHVRGADSWLSSNAKNWHEIPFLVREIRVRFSPCTQKRCIRCKNKVTFVGRSPGTPNVNGEGSE
jgi:hypothetical protein